MNFCKKIDLKKQLEKIYLALATPRLLLPLLNNHRHPEIEVEVEIERIYKLLVNPLMPKRCFLCPYKKYLINPLLPDCKTNFSRIFKTIFCAIFKMLRPERDCYVPNSHLVVHKETLKPHRRKEWVNPRVVSAGADCFLFFLQMKPLNVNLKLDWRILFKNPQAGISSLSQRMGSCGIFFLQ